MNELLVTFINLFDAEALIAMLRDWGWIAYIILFAIIFAETGLLIGFCLPGDSLLFVAGFVCSEAMDYSLNVWVLVPLLITAAVTGDTVGYWLGHSTGPRIFCREDSLLFHRKHLLRANAFYERYGVRSIVLARFVPIVRTFVPFVAGVGRMNYRRFVQYNFWGGVGWITSMTLAGYWLGGLDFVQKNLEKAVLLVVFVSLLPILWEVLNARLRRNRKVPPALEPAVEACDGEDYRT